jgi:hypothetical protein
MPKILRLDGSNRARLTLCSSLACYIAWCHDKIVVPILIYVQSQTGPSASSSATSSYESIVQIFEIKQSASDAEKGVGRNE